MTPRHPALTPRPRSVTPREHAGVATAVELYLTIALAFVLAVLIVLAPRRANAQIAPDSPRLISPHGSGGLAFHWVRAETLPGDDGVLLATWAMPGLPKGMRLRGGLGKGVAEEEAFFVGFDYQAPVMRGTGPKPFDLDWHSGLGASSGEYVLVTLPVGITGSVSLTSESVWIAPYMTAGIAADLRMGVDAPEREFEVQPALDVGLDMSFDRARKVVVRAAASLGDRQAVSVGLAFGLGKLAR